MPNKTFYRCFLWLLIINLCFIVPVHAQYFDFSSTKKKVNIPFRMVRNMVVVQLKINERGPFNFIMDTGVGTMVITDPSLIDSININSKHILKLRGLGEGENYEAYATSALQVSIPGLTSYNVCAAVLKHDHFGLSNYAGMHIHGLLGYEFFNNLAVKVNFADSTMTVYRPQDEALYAKGEKLPISIEDHKPYLTTTVKMPDGTIKLTKLVIDLGAGHPLSLENMGGLKTMPKQSITANLGIGFNGPIDGYMSRIQQIDLGKYKIKNLISSFPVDDSLQKVCDVKRDGNLGVGLLKKFIVTFDYHNNVIYLKPSSDYGEPFEHDMSGLEYYADGDGFHHVIISRVEPGSAADMVGLEKNDEIMSINFKPIGMMTLEEIDNLFKSQDHRNLLLEVYHDKKYDNVVMTLKRRI